MSKDKVYRKLIQSRRWKALRIQALKERPYCEVCEKKGMKIGATEIHHIMPVEPALTAAEKERLMFDPLNLQCLCRSCHREIHKEMRIHSKETVRKRQRQRVEAVLRAFCPQLLSGETPGGVF